MFNFQKVATYGKASRSKESSFVNITNVGDCPIYFLDYDMLSEGFKKISVMILIQRGGFVFLEDDVLPHSDVFEFDMRNTDGFPTNDAIFQEAVRRTVYNAGTTIVKSTLRLVGVAEDDDAVTYIYTAAVNNVLNNNSRTIKFDQLTSNEFMNKCSPKDIF